MKKKKTNEKLKNKKFVKGLFTILIATVLLFSLVPLSAIETNTSNTSTTDTFDINVLNKAKAASIKITWNGNGGKIGSKKTTVKSIKKGSKIGKLPTTPKRTGYGLKGWYTKKNGGTKITKNIVPKKKVTYYAQWLKTYTLTFDPNGGKVTPNSKKVAKTKTYGTLPTSTRSGYTFKGWYTSKTGGTKVSSTTKMSAKNIKVYAQWTKVLTASEKKLLGYWSSISSNTASTYTFNNDGTFLYIGILETSYSKFYNQIKGYWYESRGTIYMTSQQYRTSNDGKTFTSWMPSATPNDSMKISLGSDERGPYFRELTYNIKYYKSLTY